MSELITRTARLTPYVKRPRQASGYVTAYTYEPAPNDRSAELGNLLVVIEVISSGRIAEEVVDLVIETCGQRYYQPDQPFESVLDRFEAAIKAVNGELSHYIDRGNAAWVGKLSAIVAIQAGAELHLAQTGSAEAFLARGRSSTRITASAAPRGPQANKTFGAITSGTLEAGDRLLFATPALIHQVPLERLRKLMANATPSGTISELSGLLGGSSSAERIAALAVEVATPEQAALQLRSEAPDDIVLQPDESALAVAKQAALPLAQTAVASSKRIGVTAAQGLAQAKPHAAKSSRWLRRQAATLPSRPRVLIGMAIVVAVVGVGGIALSVHNRHEHELTTLQEHYIELAATVQTNATQLSSTKAGAAEASLVSLQGQVKTLATDSHFKALDQRLAKADLPTGTPRTVAALQLQIGQLLDRAELVEHVTTKNLVTLTAKTSQYQFMGLIGNRIVAVTADGRTIASIDPATGATSLSKADASHLGTIVAVAPSSDGSGLYLLTNKPEVWLYQPGGDSLTQTAVENGSWPASSSIASYNGNLYLLGNDGSITKSLRSLSGFGPAAVAVASSSQTTGAKALAIDGSVYVMNPGAVSQYLSGQLKQSLPVPSGLSHSTSLQVFADDTKLLACDTTTGRIGSFSFSSGKIAYQRQFVITGATIRAAVVDDAGQSVYVLTDKGISTFSL